MPQICFTRESNDRTEMYFAEMQRRRDSLSSTALNEIGESCCSSSADFVSKYQSLPHYLMACLDYCAIVYRGRYHFHFTKADMARLLSAEALIPEKEGELIDNLAKNVIDELIHLGLLIETHKESLFFYHVPHIDCDFNESYVNLCVVEVDEVEFLAEAANLPVRAIIRHRRNNIPPDFKTLKIRSLFCTSFGSGFSRAYMETICSLQYLLVLHLGGISGGRLPDEVGDLFHLRYLSLSYLDMDELPQTLGNLQNLQTLDIIAHRKLKELPLQVFNIQQLRHINIITDPCTSSGIRVPSGIGTLKSLLTLGEVYAGGAIASELSSLTQLQQLSVACVSEDNSTQLFAAITKMENLVSLSLKADEFDSLNSSVLDLESFSPPSSIKHLRLYGVLVEMPAWLASMENLTVLHLSHSNLLEPPAPALQFLPKLKVLHIFYAYRVRCIGKEFCDAGGFPKLERLTFQHEDILVEWTQIGRGAFPSLRYLEFLFCPNLRFLPEGLENVSSLQVLNLCGTHMDFKRRLLGEESYKIKHIPKVSFHEKII